VVYSFVSLWYIHGIALLKAHEVDIIIIMPTECRPGRWHDGQRIQAKDGTVLKAKRLLQYELFYSLHD
jgi:hypothetical protein